MKLDRALGLLGMLYVSHKALIGEELTHSLSKVYLLIASTNTSSSQYHSLLKKAKTLALKVDLTYQSEELGAALGREKVTFVGITDQKAALAYLKKRRNSYEKEQLPEQKEEL